MAFPPKHSTAEEVPMRQGFEHYFKPAEEKRREILENGLISVDTNILLDFYRVSNKTREALFNAFEARKDRLWLAHQVADEFYRNRVSAIHEQIKNCADFAKSGEDYAKKINELIRGHRAYPHLDDERAKAISISIDAAVEQSNENSRFLNSLLKNDDVLERIEALFKSRVGAKPEERRLKELHLEVEDRYKRRIPPGYADFEAKKKSGKDPYGDGVLWLQLVEHAKSNGSDFVFVTNEEKEDWWVKASGKLQDFRVELREEFSRITNKTIEIYQSSQFLSLVAEDRGADTEAVKELEGLRTISSELSFNSDEELDLKSHYMLEAYKILCEDFATIASGELMPLSVPISTFRFDGQLYKRLRLFELKLGQVESSPPGPMREKQKRSLMRSAHENLTLVLNNRIRI